MFVCVCAFHNAGGQRACGVVVSTATVFSRNAVTPGKPCTAACMNARARAYRGLHACVWCGFLSGPVAPSLAAHSPLFTLCSLLI